MKTAYFPPFYLLPFLIVVNSQSLSRSPAGTTCEFIVGFLSSLLPELSSAWARYFPSSRVPELATSRALELLSSLLPELSSS